MRQIRFIKNHWARIPDGEVHPDLRDIAIGPAMASHKYEPGDIPGVGSAPPLPDIEIEWQEQDPKGKMVEVLRAGQPMKKVAQISKTGLLYDRLVEQGLAIFLGSGAPTPSGISDEEQRLMEFEKMIGIPIEELDTVYRERGARSIVQKMHVLSEIQSARQTETAAALATVGGSRKKVK